MSRRGGRPLGPAVVLGLVLLAGACAGESGGNDGAGGGEAGGGGGGGAGGGPPSAEEALARNACPDDVRLRVPDGFDPATCWSIVDVTHPLLVGDQVFGVAPVDGKMPPDGNTPPMALAAFDVASGARVWVSDPLPGEVHRTAVADVEGEPGVAVLVSVDADGDAVTAPSAAWGYLAWPADAGEDSPGEPAVHVEGPTESDPAFAETHWTGQGLLAGDRLLRPAADRFAPVTLDVEPMMVEAYDLGEAFGGVSGEGDVLLSYVSGVAWPTGGPDDGNSYVGWLARDAGGATVWDAVTSFPNQSDVAISAEGPPRLPVVVGDHALTITATDDTNGDFTLEWLDARSGQPARPTAADLAGSIPDAGAADADALLSPDGRHLFVTGWDSAVVVDVEAGTARRVASDFVVEGHAIDGTTLYGTTDNGSVTVDLATADATPLDEGQLAIDAIAGDTAILVPHETADAAVSLSDALVVVRRS